MKNLLSAGCAILPAVFFVVLTGFASVPAGYSEYQERPLAIVRHFKPAVNVGKLSGDTKVLNLEEDVGEQLFSGDTLTTDAEGYALVVFMDNSIAKVKPGSSLVLNGGAEPASKSGNTRIDLRLGELFLDVQPQGNSTFEVSTSRSLASVKGTQFGNTSEGFVWVKQGQVDVEALISGETVSLFERMFARVSDEGSAVELGTLSADEISGLEAGFSAADEGLTKKQMIIRFRDANGQIREVVIDYFEKTDG